MEEHVLSSLDRRHADAEGNVELELATILDCHFKDKFFSESTERMRGRRLLEEEVVKSAADHEQQQGCEARKLLQNAPRQMF